MNFKAKSESITICQYVTHKQIVNQTNELVYYIRLDTTNNSLFSCSQPDNDSLEDNKPTLGHRPITGSEAFLAKLDALKFDSSPSPAFPSATTGDWNPTTPPTPPQTPPVRDLPKPDQWLDTLTSKVSLEGSLGKLSHPPLLHLRAQSMSAAESFLHKPDPFDAEWAAQNAIAEGRPHHKLTHQNTNPFLSSPNHSPSGVKAFQVQL